uniref:SAM domain-containing protein n=1 Tax=Rhipicephalus appendiculatus TaxID=34631 RepID=A0A131YWE2_RHIAP
MSSKSEMSTSQWVQFFRAAGLPQDVSVQYAVVFGDNRIQWGMLMDLTKEYLFDMGIHTMGDVIAILKHAKYVHSKEAQEKLMRSTPSGAQMAVGIPRRFTPVKASPRVEPLVEAAPVSRTNFQRNYAAPEPEPRATVRPLTKRRHGDEPATSSPLPPKRLGIGSSASERVAPQPVAHGEGPTLKVVLPSGSTARTRQLLAASQQGLSAGTQAAGKRSVFDRLGESTVSSTTDSKSGNSTVFQRLGPSAAEEPESDPPRTVLTTKRQLPAPYQAVLAAAAKPSRIISLTSSAKTARPLMRRQVLPPTAASRASVIIGDSSGGGGGGGTVMLRRSITEATSGRLGGSQGRFSTLAGATSQKVATARDRLGSKFATTAGVVRTTVRTTVPTTRMGSTVVPTSKRVTLVAPRVGFSGSTAAPQSVFARLGANR